MFGWSELENSVLFCIGGAVIIASYVTIRVLSTRLDDRLILALGVACILVGLTVACIFLPFATQLNRTNDFVELSHNVTGSNSTAQQYDYTFFPVFVVFVGLDVLGLPAIAICSASLFTKMIHHSNQGNY